MLNINDLLKRGTGALLVHTVRDMKNIPQRLDFHPEGDVFTHTAYVWYQVRHNPILSFVALLHDLGKRETLKYNSKGQPTAHGHEKISEQVYVPKFTNDENSEYYERVKILVRYHMIKHVWNKMRETKRQSYKEKIGDVNLGLLKIFSEADDMVSFFQKTDENEREIARSEFDTFLKEVVEKI